VKLVSSPSDQEPSNRSVSGQARWQRHLRFSFTMPIGLPIYLDRTLTGVRWDCPNCGGDGTVELRRPFTGYIFRCRRCRRWLYRFLTRAGNALSHELGIG